MTTASGPPSARSAGDQIPPGSHLVEVRVTELRQLFNAIDPSPFRERDLDPKAEAFIVEWSSDFPSAAPMALRVHLEREAGSEDDAATLRAAIHEFFGQRAAGTRRKLRELFHRGRISLVIALAFLAAATLAGDALTAFIPDNRAAVILREGFLIGGWVAMWRPLEVFLYDWWPIRAEARHLERLSRIPVRLEWMA